MSPVPDKIEVSNETHSDAGSSAEDVSPTSSPRSPSTDSESDFSDSPDSFFGELEPYEPNLNGPSADEKAQYRGKPSGTVHQAPFNPDPGNPPPGPVPVIAPAPAIGPERRRQGGGDRAVAQATPFDPPGVVLNPPVND